MSSGHPRVNCCVPGCRGGTTTIQPFPEGCCDLETGGEPEWICSRHWPRVPRLLKARRRALIRQWRRLTRRYRTTAFWELDPGSGGRIRLVRLEGLIRAYLARGRQEAGSEVEAPAGSLEEELARLGLG